MDPPLVRKMRWFHAHFGVFSSLCSSCEPAMVRPATNMDCGHLRNYGMKTKPTRRQRPLAFVVLRDGYTNTE